MQQTRKNTIQICCKKQEDKGKEEENVLWRKQKEEDGILNKAGNHMINIEGLNLKITSLKGKGKVVNIDVTMDEARGLYDELDSIFRNQEVSPTTYPPDLPDKPINRPNLYDVWHKEDKPISITKPHNQ